MRYQDHEICEKTSNENNKRKLSLPEPTKQNSTSRANATTKAYFPLAKDIYFIIANQSRC